MFYFIVSILLSVFARLNSGEPVSKFDGILGAPVENISNMVQLAPYFLPYNPVIIEIGGGDGKTLASFRSWCKQGGQVIVFEPNPRAFDILLKNIQGAAEIVPVNMAVNYYSGMADLYVSNIVPPNGTVETSSLLPQSKRKFSHSDSVIQVPCVTLDDWCRDHGFHKVDMIKIDVEGLELQILQHSLETLKKVKVICTKTNFQKFRKNGTLFPELKKFLQRNGFVMLAHWYKEGLQGEATFLREEIYEALFK